MEKQKMEEKAMEENKKTNPDSERKQKLVSAILMAFVCILLMGGGTYAWFTMSNTAKVQSLQLNVASEGNLYISKADDFASSKKTYVDWYSDGEGPKETLYPCTTEDGIKMKKPVYSSETTIGSAIEIPELANDTTKEKELYCLEKTFYLYMDDGSTGTTGKRVYNVHLAQKTGTDTVDGTYFINGGSKSGTQFPECCVRVSFEVDGVIMAVYEPNSDAHNNGDYATDNVNTTVVTSTHLQSAQGTFTNTSTTMKPLVTGDSDGLFKIAGNKSKAVTIRVWFEGTDTDCCNDINLNDVAAQFKFIAIKKSCQCECRSGQGFLLPR